MIRAGLLCLAMLACACIDDAPDGDASPVVLECGARPLAPGWSAAFERATVTLSRDDYSALIAYVDEMRAWSTCAEGVRW